MRVFTTLPQENLATVGQAAQAIEATGYTGVSTQENRHEPFLSLAVAGAAPKRIELHTGVAIAFARSPMAVANVGWDLASSFGGSRVTLGIRSPGGGQNGGGLAGDAGHRQPGARPQRAALLGAVVAAGAAHSRVRPGGAGDLGGVEGRRQ